MKKERLGITFDLPQIPWPGGNEALAAAVSQALREVSKECPGEMICHVCKHTTKSGSQFWAASNGPLGYYLIGLKVMYATITLQPPVV